MLCNARPQHRLRLRLRPHQLRHLSLLQGAPLVALVAAGVAVVVEVALLRRTDSKGSKVRGSKARDNRGSEASKGSKVWEWVKV